MTGTLAFIGGAPFGEGCTFDQLLLDASGGSEVVLLPTAAAYEHPDRLVAQATTWFDTLGATVKGLEVLTRSQSLDPSHVDTVRSARFIYLAGGSSMHLRSVLMHSPLWDALVAAWEDGCVVAGAAAGAQVLGDPMVDSRGGAFTVGLGLLPGVAVMPEQENWRPDMVHRTRQLAPDTTLLLGIDSCTAVLRGSDGAWTSSGSGSVSAYLGGQTVDLAEVRL